jgi:threonine dehydrogenase-like Zn-dependent dehydrogenase
VSSSFLAICIADLLVDRCRPGDSTEFCSPSGARDNSQHASNCHVRRGGPAPARAYIEELLPDVLEGKIEPGRVFDRVGPLDDVSDGYRAMNEREAIKVMIEF